MITTLAGENWFALKSELDKRVNEFVKEYGDLAIEKIEAEDTEIKDLVQAIQTPGFLVPKKLYIIYDLSKNKPAAEGIEQIFELEADNEIILVEGKLDKRGVYYKTLKKKTDFKEFGEPDEQQTIGWILDQAKGLGASLSRADGSYLYSRVGGNQGRLFNELKKLSDYDPQITKSNIDLLVEPTPQGSIFDLLSVAFAGNSKRTMELYQQLRLQKVEPQAVLYMIGWQMHVVALVESAKDVNSGELARESGINPFVLQKTERIAANLSRQQIAKTLSLLAELDYKLKNTATDADEAIKYLLTDITTS